MFWGFFWKKVEKSCGNIWLVLVFCSTFATANGKNGACESRSLQQRIEFIEMIAIDKEQ